MALIPFGGELSWPSTEINEMVESCISLYLRTTNKKVEFQVAYKETLPPVLVDREALRIALINLIRNGIEAMPDGGLLKVSTGKENGFVFMEVADTGKGIPGQELPLLFIPHYSRKKEGFGLGLAIAHDIIEAHRGEIKIESKEGRGSIFKIILPIRWID
ncbi:MAG: ATP-binding protein [bacterium]|nr:ATP-binding protein [bacterium]